MYGVGVPNMDAIRDLLGYRIFTARQARRWRQQDLAEAVGVEQQRVSRWEAGTLTPNLAMIEKLGTVLGVSPAWLVGWADN